MTLDPRPDQAIDPPGIAVSPGGAAGVFRGRLIIVQGVTAPPGSGIFVYDNAGDLIGSWVGIGGKDPIDGDTVQLGLTVQDGTGTLIANMQGGNLTLTKASGVLAPPDIAVQDNTVTTSPNLSEINAGSILTGIIQSIQPGTTVTTEAWHPMPAIQAGWSVGGHASYRLTAQGDLQVAFKDLVPGTDTDGTVIWAAGSLPAAYRVSNAHLIVAYTQQQRTSGTTVESAALEFETDGSIQCAGVAAASTRLDLYATIPLNDS